MTTRIFIHGLESSNRGTKSVFFRERYPDMIIPHFIGGLQERMDQLFNVLENKRDIRMVGSSYGGLMAALFAMSAERRIRRLLLLAPAIHVIDSAPYELKTISTAAWICHGRQDEVIPLVDVTLKAQACFSHLTFKVVDDDHFLHRTFKNIDWGRLLT